MTSGIFWDRCILCQQEDDENLKQPAKNTKKEDIIRTYCNTVVLLKEFDYNLPGKFFHGHRGLSTLINYNNLPHIFHEKEAKWHS